jgi:hypothetical protein
MAEPIQSEYRQLMNGLAAGIDNILNGEARPKKLAFVVLIAEFGQIEGGRVNYISNGERADCIAMMKEWIARAEGRYSEGGGHV